jgi:hypothetical protein
VLLLNHYWNWTSKSGLVGLGQSQLWNWTSKSGLGQSQLWNWTSKSGLGQSQLWNWTSKSGLGQSQLWNWTSKSGLGDIMTHTVTLQSYCIIQIRIWTSQYENNIKWLKKLGAWQLIGRNQILLWQHFIQIWIRLTFGWIETPSQFVQKRVVQWSYENYPDLDRLQIWTYSLLAI